jgi:hypothetical protein
VIDLTAVIEQFLEPAEPGVLVELDRDDAAALAAEVRAARAVVAAARLVGDPDLDEVDVAEQLADAIDAYDQATSNVPPTTTGGTRR